MATRIVGLNAPDLKVGESAPLLTLELTLRPVGLIAPFFLPVGDSAPERPEKPLLNDGAPLLNDGAALLTDI